MKVTMSTTTDEAMTIIHRIEKPAEFIDKLEIGPANNRVIIHLDFDNPDQCINRINNAASMLRYANEQIINNLPKKD